MISVVEQPQNIVDLTKEQLIESTQFHLILIYINYNALADQQIIIFNKEGPKTA